MWQIFTIMLFVCLAVLLGRYLLLRRELGRMAKTMEEIRTQATNRQLTIGTQQPQVARLAVAINALYEDMDERRAQHRAAMSEVRSGMANISHDLRTPLTSILGYLKLLQSDDNTPEQSAHYLDIALQKSQALHRLVDGLFEMARLESGGYSFEHERLDAAALLAEELAAAYAQLDESGLPLEVALPQGPLYIVGDKAALGRVFGNLLQNMARHAQAPLSIRAGEEDGCAVFRFENRAPDLSLSDVDQLFERFFTGDRMRSGKDTGLGLAIVKEFVEQMNGSIEATLREGMLCFTLCFTLVPRV